MTTQIATRYDHEVRVERGRQWGGTTYVNETWGVNIWVQGEHDNYRWMGWPCESLKEARELARYHYESLVGEDRVAKLTLSLKAKR